MEKQTLADQYSEKLVLLSWEELNSLRKNRLKFILILIAIASLFSVIVSYIIHEQKDTFVLVVITFFGGFMVSIIVFFIWQNTRDIQFGKKKIIRGYINQKDPETTYTNSGYPTSEYLYIIISEKKILVNAIEHSKFKIGDFIEIEMMPKTSHVLKITKIESKIESEIVLYHEQKPVFVENKKTNISLALSKDDKKIIKTRIYYRILVVLVTGFMLAYILYDLIFFFLISFIPVSVQIKLFENDVAFVGRLWSYKLALFMFVLFIVYIRIAALIRDLRNGNKNIILATIDDKIREGYWNYYFYSNENRYKISKQTYNQVSIGQTVMLHIAPHSDTFLELEQV